MNVRPTTCERTAQLVSLDLDGQLSYFERRLLAHHLVRCAACGEQARRTTAVTELLRSEPLAPVQLPGLPVRSRRTRRAAGALALASVVSVATVSAWLGFAPGAGQETLILSGPARITAARPPNDRFDWASGPPRATQIVQFVPGGRFTFGS
jgi:hypothetical protein